jgi:hypothetical protein
MLAHDHSPDLGANSTAATITEAQLTSERQRACIDNRFGFREIFNWVDDRRIAVNKKKLSNFSAMKNRVAS